VAEATVTSKGQITIPIDVRRRLGLETGSRVHFVLTDAGTYEFIPVNQSVRSLRGLIPAPELAVSLTDMDRAMEAGATGIDAP
jgi:antitoxin PrlF